MSTEPLSIRLASGFARLQQLTTAQQNTQDLTRAHRIDALYHRQFMLLLGAISEQDQATAAAIRHLKSLDS